MQVNLLFLLCVQSQPLFPGFQDLHCRLTGAESTETIPPMMILLQIHLYVLNHDVSMGLVLSHTVKIHSVLVTQQGFCGGITLAPLTDEESFCQNWNNHAPEWVHLYTTPLFHQVIWQVESSEVRIWRHHIVELVEFLNPGMLFQPECYPVHQIRKHTELDSMKIFWYANTHWGNAFHNPDDAFWGFNYSIFHIMSCILSCRLIIVSGEYYSLEA